MPAVAVVLVALLLGGLFLWAQHGALFSRRYGREQETIDQRTDKTTRDPRRPSLD